MDVIRSRVRPPRLATFAGLLFWLAAGLPAVAQLRIDTLQWRPDGRLEMNFPGDTGSNGSLGALNVTDADVTVDLPPDGRLHYTTVTVA